MTLKEMFQKVMAEYNEVDGTKWEKANPFYAKWHSHRLDIINELMRNSKLDFTNTYISDIQKNGKAKLLGNSGNWLKVFGVSIRDRRFPSVSAGIYITYLFNRDTHECYLTLAQGSDEYDNSVRKIKPRVVDLQDKLKGVLNGSGFDTTTPDTGKPDYDAGTIAHKKYTLTTLPDDADLYADLRAMEKIYRYYLDNIYPTETSGSAPAPTGSTASANDETDTENSDDTVASTAAPSSTGVYTYDNPIIKTGKNLIIYGTPGCGKSYKLDTDLKSHGIGKDETFRVTFHLDYTYTDFVGQILPKLKAGGGVEYEFIPGPFTLALQTAIANKDKAVALIIEEINRGNAASIFGDLFQLLDRNDEGTSQYELTNKQITDHLNKELGYSLNYIKIPSNLSLYATMNTGDQNVFTLDTAFKRRWEFEKLSNIFKPSDKHKDLYIPGMSNVTWESFVKAINEHMIGGGTLDSEDKQLGKYFVTESQLVDFGEKNEPKEKKFAYKVLEYLWNDVAKFDRDRWFKTGDYKTLDAVIDKWINGNGQDVFNSNLKFEIKNPLAAPATAMPTPPAPEADDGVTEE